MKKTPIAEMTDAELGAEVRKDAALFKEQIDGNPQLLYSISMALLSLAMASNAGELEMKIPNATYKGKPNGNWRILVKQF